MRGGKGKRSCIEKFQFIRSIELWRDPLIPEIYRRSARCYATLYERRVGRMPITFQFVHVGGPDGRTDRRVRRSDEPSLLAFLRFLTDRERNDDNNILPLCMLVRALAFRFRESLLTGGNGERRSRVGDRRIERICLASRGSSVSYIRFFYGSCKIA